MLFDKSDKVTNVNYNPCCSTSAKYSAPGNHGTRLMLVNEVALGNIKVGEIRFAFAFLKLSFEQNQKPGPIIRPSIRCPDGSFGGRGDNIGSNPPFLLNCCFHN